MNGPLNPTAALPLTRWLWLEANEFAWRLKASALVSLLGVLESEI
jgi:hypothetical protein